MLIAEFRTRNAAWVPIHLNNTYVVIRSSEKMELHSIRIDDRLYKFLKKRRLIPRESFYSVIWRLIKKGRKEGGKA